MPVTQFTTNELLWLLLKVCEAIRINVGMYGYRYIYAQVKHSF